MDKDDKNQSDDDSSSTSEYQDTYEDLPMEIDEEGNGESLAQHELSHSSTNEELRDMSLLGFALSSENNTEPDYHQSIINNANHSQFTGDESFVMIELQHDVIVQQDGSNMTRTDDLEHANNGQAIDLLVSRTHHEKNCKIYENCNKNERIKGSAKQTDLSSFKGYRDLKPDYSSSSELHTQNSEQSDEDQETTSSTNLLVFHETQSNVRTLHLGSGEGHTSKKVHHQRNYHDHHFEHSSSPSKDWPEDNTDFVHDNEDVKQKTRNHEQQYSSRHPSDIPTSIAGSHQEHTEESAEDAEIADKTNYSISPDFERNMIGLKVGFNEENISDNVDTRGCHNDNNLNDPSSSIYDTKYNTDSLYVNGDDKHKEIRQEGFHSNKFLKNHQNSDAGAYREGLSEHKENQRLFLTAKHTQNSADDLSKDRKITQNVTEREREYDKACHSGTSSPTRSDNETDHAEDDCTRGRDIVTDAPSQENYIPDGKYNYEAFPTGKSCNGYRSSQEELNNNNYRTEESDDEAHVEIESHSRKRRNKLTLETTLANSADEGDISDEQVTEDGEDEDDDRSNSPASSRDKFIYVQQSWESYVESNKNIPDWEEDDEDDLEEIWTRSIFAGDKNEIFYRDVILYDEGEDDEDNVKGIVRDWMEGKIVYVGEPSEEILEIRERILNDSGDTTTIKNSKQIVLGGARPKTYKKKHEEHVQVSHRVEYEDAGSDQRSRRRHFQESVYSRRSEWYSEEDDSDHTIIQRLQFHNHKGRYYERTGDSESEDEYDQENHREESFNRGKSSTLISEDDDEVQQPLPSNSYKSKVRNSEDKYHKIELPGNEAGIYRDADRRSSDDEDYICSPYPTVEYLAQQPNFETDTETLLERFGSGEAVKKTIENNRHIFHCTNNWVKLRPSVHVCPSYSSQEGCPDRASCLSFHICQDFLINECKDAACIMGHNIQTNHNKKVLKRVCMENLESHVVLNIVRSLFGGFVSDRKEVDFPKSKEGYSFQPTSVTKQVTDASNALQSNQDKDRIQNPKGKLNFTNFKKWLPLPTMNNAQGATRTFGTVWSHYTGGDIEIEEICSKGLESVCEHETDGCKRLHAKLPYYWQIKPGRDIGWMNLQEQQVKHLENKYCNPALEGTFLPPVDKKEKRNHIHVILGDEVWYADFINMKLINDSTQEPWQIRRLQLQTVGKGNKWKSHIWYFQDNEGDWVPYGEIVTFGKHKIRSKIRSSNIEQCYLNKANTVNFSIPYHNLSYVIDFAKMIQINTKTNVVRDVRRRPKPTENI